MADMRVEIAGLEFPNPILPADVRLWLGKYIDELDEKLHAPAMPAEAPPTSPVPFPAVPPQAPKAPPIPFSSPGRGVAGRR